MCLAHSGRETDLIRTAAVSIDRKMHHDDKNYECTTCCSIFFSLFDEMMEATEILPSSEKSDREYGDMEYVKIRLGWSRRIHFSQNSKMNSRFLDIPGGRKHENSLGTDEIFSDAATQFGACVRQNSFRMWLCGHTEIDLFWHAKIVTT